MTDQKVVKTEENKPCGCHVVIYADDSNIVTPCVVHGLLAAADSLIAAGQALGATATGIVAQQKQESMQAAIAAGLGRKKC